MSGARALLLAAGIVEHLRQTLQTARKCGRVIDAIKHIHVVGENFLPRAQCREVETHGALVRALQILALVGG